MAKKKTVDDVAGDEVVQPTTEQPSQVSTELKSVTTEQVGEYVVVDDTAPTATAENAAAAIHTLTSRLDQLRLIRKMVQAQKHQQILAMELSKRVEKRRRKDVLERESRKRNWRTR